METVSVVTSSRPILLVSAGSGPTLLYNTDTNNSIQMGDNIGINILNNDTVAPLPPQSSLVVDGTRDVYALPAIPGTTVQIAVIPGGVNFFQPPSRIVIAGPNEGLFSYSPTRGPGNLVATTGVQPFASGPPQFDQYGNSYLPGDTTYYNTGGAGNLTAPIIAVSQSFNEITSSTAPNYHGTFTGNLWEISNIWFFLDDELWLFPSGTSDDSGAINGQFAAGVKRIHLLPGATDFFITNQIKVGLGQHLEAGPEVTIHNNSGTYAISISNSGAYVADATASVTGGFNIKCAGLAQGGIEFGDIAGMRIDIQVENSTAIAAHALNGNHFSEWNEVQLKIFNCSRGLVFERSGTGTNSYDRSKYHVYVSQPSGDSIVELGGVAGDVDLAQGELEIYGNAHSTSTAIKFNTAGSLIEECHLHVGLENDGGVGAAPQTISFGGNGKIQNCYGALSFTGPAWTPSDNTGNEITGFEGTIGGDVTLGQTTPINIATGMPAGWTGNIWARTVGDNVYLDLELTIANTTVVTAGETIVSGLTYPWKPINNKYMAANLLTSSNQLVPVIIDTGGNIRFLGAGFTAAASDFLFGQIVYSNQK